MLDVLLLQQHHLVADLGSTPCTHYSQINFLNSMQLFRKFCKNHMLADDGRLVVFMFVITYCFIIWLSILLLYEQQRYLFA